MSLISPPQPVSAWTVDTLKMAIELEIKSLADVTSSRFIAGDTRATEAQEAIKVGLANAQRALDAAAVLAKDAVGEAKTAHAAEHTAQAMALALAQLEMKERLVEMNAFRKQMAEERGDFVTRDRLAAAVTSMEGALLSAVTAQQALTALLDGKVMAMGVNLDSKIHTAEVTLDAKIQSNTLSVSNMQSRFTAYGTALTVAIVVFELVIKYVVK